MLTILSAGPVFKSLDLSTFEGIEAFEAFEAVTS
jgi:hypothetical protein